jgi:hypothetical protein
MSVRLCNLRDVSTGELEEMRQLLDEHHIDYYETPAGKWGISPPAIWLIDETRLQEARDLLATYQQERSQRMRAEYEQQKSLGQVETLLDRVKRDPFRFLFYLAIIIAVMYFSIKPFLHFGR